MHGHADALRRGDGSLPRLVVPWGQSTREPDGAPKRRLLPHAHSLEHKFLTLSQAAIGAAAAH